MKTNIPYEYLLSLKGLEIAKHQIPIVFKMLNDCKNLGQTHPLLLELLILAIVEDQFNTELSLVRNVKTIELIP